MKALEKAFAKAEKEAPAGGYPPCGPSVKGPCKPDVTSEIGTLRAGKLSKGSALQAAVHGHGEALRGAWLAPDGSEWRVGYMYTGVPGPDTGVVYRRAAGGSSFEIVYTKPANELGHIWGSSEKDVWVAGVRTLAHFDGARWKEEPIPMRDGNLSGVWGNGKELYVVGGADGRKSEGRIYRRDAAGTWSLDGTSGAFLFDVSGTGSVVIAVGNDGQILRRKAAGSWINEGTGKRQNTRVSMTGERDLWVAGSGLLHSTGDGTWTVVKLPGDRQVTEVWARNANDVFAGTLGGLYAWDGATWKATAWKHEARALAGNADTLLIANQHM